MNTRKILSSITALAAIASLSLAIPVLAEDNASSSTQGDRGDQKVMLQGKIDSHDNGHFNMDQVNRMAPILSGVVSNLSGNTFTISIVKKVHPVETRDGDHPSTSTAPVVATSTTVVYTVDATTAQIWKNNATTTIASVANGDVVYVRGHVTASSTIAATIITDGERNVKPQPKPSPKPKKDQNEDNQNNFLGDGQPVVGGTVSAVSTTTVTITNGTLTYTVDVTNAKVLQGDNASSTIANIKVGDMLLVQGSVNGTSITATGVIDQTKPAEKKVTQKILDSVRSFFSRFFRF